MNHMEKSFSKLHKRNLRLEQCEEIKIHRDILHKERKVRKAIKSNNNNKELNKKVEENIQIVVRMRIIRTEIYQVIPPHKNLIKIKHILKIDRMPTKKSSSISSKIKHLSLTKQRLEIKVSNNMSLMTHSKMLAMNITRTMIGAIQTFILILKIIVNHKGTVEIVKPQKMPRIIIMTTQTVLMMMTTMIMKTIIHHHNIHTIYTKEIMMTILNCRMTIQGQIIQKMRMSMMMKRRMMLQTQTGIIVMVLTIIQKQIRIKVDLSLVLKNILIDRKE